MTINQLRAFIAVCDEASFSGAARKLRRAQSAISHAVASLEEALGVALFARDGRKPELTAAGRLLLADARVVVADAEQMKNRAKSIARDGVRELAFGVDPHFPRRALAEALAELRSEYPLLQVKLFSQMPHQNESLVLAGSFAFALVVAQSPVADPTLLERWPLRTEPFTAVCAPFHPLISVPPPVGVVELRRHTQLVVTDPDADARGQATCAIGERVWLVADVAAARDFALAGLGWTHMPLETIVDDIAAGRLIELEIQPAGEGRAHLAFAISSLRGRKFSECEARLIDKLRRRDAPTDA